MCEYFSQITHKIGFLQLAHHHVVLSLLVRLELLCSKQKQNNDERAQTDTATQTQSDTATQTQTHTDTQTDTQTDTKHDTHRHALIKVGGFRA